MQRLSLLSSFAFVSILGAAAGCGGPKQFTSLCDADTPPAACNTPCDPAPGAPAACPGGFHCSPDGLCDATCTQGGGQCGQGHVCTSDGRCVDDGSVVGDPEPDANCPAVHFTAMQTIPSITLLIDRSGSMNDSIGGKTRYQAVRDALVDNTNGVVTNLQSKAYFGAALFSSDNPCPRLYAVPRAMNNRNGIASLINGQGPGGNTPTGPSIDQVVADFAANPPPQGSPPIIVLATDGLPNTCNNGNDTNTGQTLSVNAAKAAYTAGIRLFILGVGNGINDQHLQAMANAGAGVQAGMANAPYFLANSPAQLQTAFDTIIGGVLSCELMISGTIDQAQAAGGTVTLNGAPLQFGTDWELVNGNTIRLLGAACTTLKSSPNPMVDAAFPCGAIVQ
ncbi:MAG: VWA domain-containing protein [Deltaproteobacteria bacterium]|nr:VWA domain-containing protein [Deltaproteobacteria bacterium]